MVVLSVMKLKWTVSFSSPMMYTSNMIVLSGCATPAQCHASIPILIFSLSSASSINTQLHVHTLSQLHIVEPLPVYFNCEMYIIIHVLRLPTIGM